MNLRVAYLISQYPAYSHTFILREITQLREKGLDIRAISINEPDRSLEKLTGIEKAEAEQTFYVKRQGAFNTYRALWQTLISNPYGLLKGLQTAITLGGWNIKRGLYHFFYLLEAVLIGQWMHDQKLTHLHVHFATPAASVGLLCKKVFGITFSFTVHGPDEFYDTSYYCLVEKIEAADFIICISYYARSQLMKLSPVSAWSKFKICRLGVDSNRFTPKQKKATDQKLHLLCVGRLTPAKGQAILLNAVAQLINQSVPVQVCFVGMGPDLEALQAHAEELNISQYVNFAGAIDQDHILDYYQLADIFVLPSFAEGLPVVLMEAMAMAIPCVTTNITGIPELIKNEQNGLLVPASDVDAMTKAIRYLIENPQIYQQISIESRNKVLAEYDLFKNTQDLFNILTQNINVLLNSSST